MAGTSVDGLVSGLNTSQLISQLMQVESVPQDRLKSQVATQETVVASYRSINSKLAALQTAAERLTSASGWQRAKATSSSSSVTASAGSDAVRTSLTFDVLGTAAAHTRRSTALADLSNVVAGGPPPQITVTTTNGPVVLHPATGTLQEVITTINSNASLGIKAIAVKVADGQYRLQVTSTGTGTSSAFTIDGLESLGGFASADAPLVAGADASIRVGTDTILSASNTFTQVVPGATFTVSKAETGVTIDLTPDPSGIARDVKALVDAANTVLSDIAAKSKPGERSVRGPLAGDLTVRQVQSFLLGAVNTSGGGSMADAGIEVDRNGQLTFDESTFLAAYADDPGTLEGLVGNNGLATRLVDVAKGASDSTNGTITLAISGRDSLIKDLNTRIEGWDRRLVARQETLKRQFSTLEAALGKMQQQASWLSGQIANLPTHSAG